MKYVREQDAIASPRGINGVLRHLVAPWTVQSERLWLGVLTLEKGGSTIAHGSPGFEALHYTLSGHGKEILDGEELETWPGTCIFIPPEPSTRSSISATSR